MKGTQVRISLFSGENKDWERWSTTFLAKARLRGYRGLFVGTKLASNKSSKEYEGFIIRNDIEYVKVFIACECDTCFGIINSSRNEQTPDGDARLAWLSLTSKFEPNTKASLIQLKRQFLDNWLNDPDQEPDQLIQSLVGMQRKLHILGHQVSEMDIIMHILKNLPNKYENTVELSDNDLENEVVNLDRVKEKIRSKFEKIQRSKVNTEGASMINGGRPGEYKGNCSYCGKYGQKANVFHKRPKSISQKGEKTERGKGNEGRFNTPLPFSCYICNKRGHKAIDFPTKKDQMEGDMKTEMNQIALQDTLTFH
jgi:hypothetical protein